MKITDIEIYTEDTDLHGYVFFATAYIRSKTLQGLSPDKKESVDNWLDITVTNHYGHVTAGHALVMLIKKCKRLTMRPSKDTLIMWKQKCGDNADVLIDDDGLDKDRMNSIIKTLAEKHNFNMSLPYEKSPVKE